MQQVLDGDAEIDMLTEKLCFVICMEIGVNIMEMLHYALVLIWKK